MVDGAESASGANVVATFRCPSRLQGSPIRSSPMKPFALAASLLSLATFTAAQNCTSTIAAASCGPTLTVTFAPQGNAGNHTIEVTCHGLDPNGIGLMAWGQTLVNIPFPTCPMLNDFQWGHVVNLDATGSYTWSRTW